MILIHKVNQYFGKQVPISASSHMVFVETINFPNLDQVDQLKKWPVATIIWPNVSCVAWEWALGKWFCSLRSQYSLHILCTFYLLCHTLYKCTLSWKIVPIIVVTINGEGLHCTQNGDQLALTCKVSRITYSGWFQTAIPPHHTGKSYSDTL